VGAVGDSSDWQKPAIVGDDHRTRLIVRVRENLPQEQPQANFVTTDATGARSMLDDSGVREAGLGMACHVHVATALERQGVGHAP